MKPRASSAKLGISLFPFLDALICMMGGLIVILAVVNRSAAHQAQRTHAAGRAVQVPSQVLAAKLRRATPQAPLADPAAEKTALDHENLSDIRDELSWRIEHLRAAREKTTHDLQKERLRLSSAEAQVWQLKQQLAELTAALRQIQGATAQQSQSHALLAQTLDAARRQLESAQQRLAAAQRDAANRKTSYAVVPYEGPNRTKRRPIYIECTAEKIIVQPEGIILLPRDLAGPPGPGNPLASTIRAIREGLLATAPDPSSPDAEPYPLFLVRPDGIVAYYEAREAMASWANEIGYQVIEQDWPLVFPPADPNLALRANQALAAARQRFEWLAQQNPELANRGAGAPRATYRVAPTGGGLIADGGPLANSGASIPSWSDGQGGGTGNYDSSAQATNSDRFGNDTNPPGANGNGANNLGGLSPNTRLSSGGGSLSTGAGSFHGGTGSGTNTGQALGNSQYAPGPPPMGVYGSLNPVLDAGGNMSGQYAVSGQGSQPGTGINGSAMRSASSSGSDNAGGRNSQGAASQGQGSGSPSSGTQSGGSQGSGSQGTAGGTPGSGLASNSAGQGSNATTRQYGDLNQKQPQPSGGYPSDTPAPINTPTPKREQPKSLAETQGKDWAVMRRGNGTSAVTRPIRLRISGAQLALLADATVNEPEQLIPLDAETNQAIPGLVQNVEQRIDRWGLAGKGLSWSPELVFEVAPDGEGRYADLQTLLDNSGWIVRRKQ